MKEWAPHIALFLTNLLYAANYSIAKVFMPEKIRAVGFIPLRVTSAAVIFFLIHFLFVREKIDKRDLPLFLACAVFGVVLNQLLFFMGLESTDPINAALLMITVPIMVLLLSSIFLKEYLDSIKIMGVFIGMFGASLIILKGYTVGLRGFGSGEVLILFNAMSFGIYLVIAKPLMVKYHPVTLLKWIFLFGGLILIPIGWRQVSYTDWTLIGPADIASMIYVVIGATIFTYLFNLFALGRVNASTVGSYIYLQPVLATFVAVLMGKGQPVLYHVWAAALIFTGVYMVSYRRKSLMPKI